ncbi:MAG: efflux RND transporter permease subunit [Gemmobacter sp.]
MARSPRRETTPSSGGILAYFTRHRTLANLLMVLLIASGLYATTQIRTQFFPDVVVGTISVTVPWPGAGANDVDRAIVQALEPALMVLDGVERTTARATEGRASITLEFEPDHDMTRALDEVQTAVDAVRHLPEDAEDAVIRRDAWRDRVTDVVITGPVDIDQLGRLGDELIDRLFAAGITRTTIQGLAAPETLVEVPATSLIRHDITLREIANAIAAEVNALPAGDVAGGAARVRTGAERRSAEDIAAIVLRRDPAGTTLTIGDLAGVQVRGIDGTRAYFAGDEPAVVVQVSRSQTGDAIAIQRQVQAVVDEMRLTLPHGVSTELIRTRAEMITDRLNILLHNGALGLGLVVLLLFLFLNARTAFWVAAGIPVAMFAAVAVMHVSGLTLNMMSLFALIIMLGIVVDEAIVVGEHADHRARYLGESPVTAAENAARRMARPVLAATLTTVVAFFGLTVIGGRFGSLISDIPFTVIAVLIASLAEVFLILPNHMAHALARSGGRDGHWYDWPSRQVNRGLRWFRETLFRPFTAFVVAARYPVLALAVLALTSQAALFVRGDLQWRFFNSPEQGSISGNFSMLPGAGRADTFAMLQEVQRATHAVADRFAAEHGENPVAHVLGQIGGNAGQALAGADTKEPEQLGSISIELIDPDRRPYSAFEFLSALQQEVRAHPRMEELSFRGARSGPGGDALSVQLSGADAEVLKSAAEALKTALAPFPEVSALEDSLAYDKEELILNLTPQGESLGFTAEALGRLLRERLNGIEAATYPDGTRSAEIRVELPEAELTADFLERMFLRSAAGQYVPLADIVTVESRSGFSTVRRENGLQLVSVTGDLSEDDPAAAVEVRRVMSDEILPRLAEEHGIAWQLSGLAEQERDFLSDATTGIGISLLGMYLILAWIFASWTRPLVIMSVIPFGLVGALYGHMLWDMPMSMFSVIGLIGMTGIIINDSIVLVAAIDEHAKNRGLLQAIVDGTADRLRAVLLTTLTTVLGLAPLLYETSSQALFLKPTVITLVYGLGFGMVLVLLVVPAGIAVQHDLGGLARALRRAARRGAGRVPVMGAALAMAALAAVTLGPALAGLPVPLAALLLPGLAPVPAALMLFIAGAGLVALAVWLGAAMLARRARG